MYHFMTDQKKCQKQKIAHLERFFAINRF